ncbi:MAG: hypothetical protein KA267_09510 [Gemmatimonadales bacterium]|nr:hypothetical protein [Gemmatimonadales bacterium]MBP6572220.1 hypothetical protein [Gemmatimonadales bacterium]MBP7621201.1 hypothetical protein [Gemmatimonadales bacterium]MBP9898611.1 hypothetical protein [Gemmatimonadales bacterium]
MTTLPTRQMLDHIGFRDWIANRAGFYTVPDRAALICVALDRGGPLRITDPVSGEALPLSIVDVLATGRFVTGLDIDRTMPAAPLPTLRRRRGGTRFVLETEMQRKRLLPRWIDWLRWAAAEKESVFGLDVWVLRYLRKATFDELAFMAQWPPSIGPRMLWAMVRANPERAITLFLRWATTGEHARFHGLGESLSVLVEGSVGTPYAERYARLLTLLADVTSNSAAG